MRRAGIWAPLLLTLASCTAVQEAETPTAQPAPSRSPTAAPTPTPTATPAPPPSATPTLNSPSPTTEASLEPYDADPSTIVGAWRDSFGHVIEYFDDGRFLVDGGGTDGGTYTFDGTILTYSSFDRGQCSGLEGMYDVTFYNGGERAELTIIRDECSGRGISIAQGGLHRRTGS